MEVKSTVNEFRTALTAEYSIGTAAVGAGLNMGVAAATTKTDMTAYSQTSKASVFTFGIPLYFKVAF